MDEVIAKANGGWQRRRPKRREYPAARWDAFFALLGECCNVKRSTEAAGVCWRHAYRKRLAEPAFRARWAAAMETGRAQLEAQLLERAARGPGPYEPGDPADYGLAEAGAGTMDAALAIRVLAMHRRSEAAPKPWEQAPDMAAVRASVLERLRAIRAHRGMEDGEDDE